MSENKINLQFLPFAIKMIVEEGSDKPNLKATSPGEVTQSTTYASAELGIEYAVHIIIIIIIIKQILTG